MCRNRASDPESVAGYGLRGVPAVFRESGTDSSLGLWPGRTKYLSFYSEIAASERDMCDRPKRGGAEQSAFGS